MSDTPPSPALRGAGEQTPPAPEVPAAARSEHTIATALIAFTLIVSSLPYLLGYALSHPGYRFVGQAYNIDDFCVYLSWTRQAADGHFWARDLFTTEPQKNIEFNVLFLLLGQIVRLTHCPIPIIFQIVRVASGVVLLALIYRLYTLCVPGSGASRLTALGLAALGGGFGWTFWPAWADRNVGYLPSDTCQPESLTFLSIYFSALFSVSTLLIVATLTCLLLAERTRRARFAAWAGVCALVLGNIHSYDVIHVAAAWGLFLIVATLLERRFPAGAWGRAALAGLIALPSVAYQFWVFMADPAFHKRAEVATHSPPFPYYALGYGLIFALAALGLLLVLLGRRTRFLSQFANWQAAGFVACWAVAGFAISYAPHVSFQRKLLMGEDIPLCLLAGATAAFLLQRLPQRLRAGALALVVLATVPSNALFFYRDYTHLINDRSETNLAPFLTAGDLDTLQWIHRNTGPSDAILGFPQLMVFVPGYCDRAVWVGHWGETPHFGDKVALFARFARQQTPDSERIAFLRQTRTQYLVYPTDVSAMNTLGQPLQFADFALSPPPYLLPVHRNSLYTIFAIRLP